MNEIKIDRISNSITFYPHWEISNGIESYVSNVSMRSCSDYPLVSDVNEITNEIGGKKTE